MRFEDSQLHIARFAARVMRRIHAAGAAGQIDLDDVKAELALVWCRARDSYDPSYGAAFSTYLHGGMIRHIERWVQRQIRQSFTLSLDAERGTAAGATLHEVVPDTSAGPHETVECASKRRLVMKNLSADAARFVTWLEFPPPALLEILKGAQARTEFARARGLKGITPAPKDVTAPMVLDLMGLDRSARHAVQKELAFWTAR